MKSSLITIDIKPHSPLHQEYTGGIFRGWLGYILKCHPLKKCSSCETTKDCPYYMVFKEQTDIKPYSILSFHAESGLRNFIKIHGDRRRFTPEILACIEEKKNKTHFGGTPYTITAMEARNIEIPSFPLGKQTTVNFVTPVALVTQQRMEMIPTLNSLIKSSVRSYNRVTKFYDREHYPYEVSDDVLNMTAPVLDFDVKQVTFVHETMEKRKITLHGVSGWVRYDTKACPPETGDILKMGEFLQVGKHSTYGFGGILVTTGEGL